jgi:hypothetical protein
MDIKANEAWQIAKKRIQEVCVLSWSRSTFPKFNVLLSFFCECSSDLLLLLPHFPPFD